MSSNTCKSCNSNVIDVARNKSGLCRECGKIRKRKQSVEEPFTFAAGVDQALNGTSVKFVTTESEDSQSLDKKAQHTYVPPLTTLVHASKYPKIISILGPYEEMDDETSALLNMDFRLFASKLQAVPDLFAGTIIQGDETILILTNEVYARSFSLDVHAEKDNETRPYGKERYKDITCGVYRKSDSPNSSKKLMVGSKCLNILITSSTTISTSPIHNVGPSTSISMSSISSSSKMYLRSKNVKKFKEILKQPTSLPTIEASYISKLRQVTSSLHNKSTYCMFRASLEPFDDVLYQPVTIFTLCDLPNNEGYGCSDKPFIKLISKFLQVVAAKIITNNTKFDMFDFDDVFGKFELINSQKKKNETKDDSNAFKKLNLLMEACRNYKEKTGDKADIMEFAHSYSLSPYAAIVSSGVSKGNKKITANIAMLLSRLFC